MNIYFRCSAHVLCVAMGSALKSPHNVPLETVVKPSPRVLDPKQEPRDLDPIGAKADVPCESISKNAGQINGIASCVSGKDGWHREPNVSNRKVYGFIHIPKVAGDSFTINSKWYVPDGTGYYGAERCPAGILQELRRRVAKRHLSGMSFGLLTFLRDPTAHVQSQYMELKYDYGWHWGGKEQFLQDCPTITAYLDRFTTGNGTKHADYIAYHPQDMQTRSLTCEGLGEDIVTQPSDIHKYMEIDAHKLGEALKSVENYTFIGITEFFQASMCMFHDKVRPGSPLPDFCDCRDKVKWSTFPKNHESHHVPYHSLKDLSQEDLQKAAVLTENDQIVYKAGLKRFYREVRELEERRGLQIHCK